MSSSGSVSQEIISFRISNIHYRLHRSGLLGSVLRHLSLVHILKPYFSKFLSNIIHHTKVVKMVTYAKEAVVVILSKYLTKAAVMVCSI